jgi:osmotically-inducible protein OsmY
MRAIKKGRRAISALAYFIRPRNFRRLPPVGFGPESWKEKTMARGSNGGFGRDEFETDDLRFREGAGFGYGRYSNEDGRDYRYHEDYGAGRPRFGGPGRRDYDERGFGDRGVFDERARRGLSDYGRGFGRRYEGGHYGDRPYDSDRGYYGYRGSEGGYHPGRYRPDIYADRRGGGSYDEEDRTFFDRASDEVASWFGDEEASERRRQDHRGRGPRNYTRSDARIAEDVNDRLTDDWSLDASDIEVEVEDREVTLSGKVASRADKRRAEDIADSVSGVTHVQNNLRVRQAGPAEGAPAPI